MRLPNIKQWFFPKEFRVIPVARGIKKENFDAVKTLIERLIDLLKLPVGPPPPDTEQQKAFLAEVAIGVWRLQKKMIDPKSKQPFPEMSKAFRHLDSIGLALQKEQVEIQDHDGEKFDPGRSIQVLEYQPTKEISEEKVIETVKPTIYYKGERISMGQVVVATPDN